MADISRLRDFVRDMTAVVDAQPRGRRGEDAVLHDGSALLAALLRHDDWLPDEFARPDATAYRQYLLHCDPRERFCVVSFVWGPGQSTPVHDHLTWGLIGVLRGNERSQRFERVRGPAEHLVPVGAPEVVGRGPIDRVSPRLGDIHQVCNPSSSEPAVSIHVYGANIGAVRRHIFDPALGVRPFVSGYSQSVVPNLWDRSHAPIGA